MGALGTDLITAAALLAVVAAAWAAGAVIARGAPAAEQVAVGLLATLGVAWLVMAQPLIGFSVIGRPWATRAALAAIAVLLIWRRPSPARPALRPLAAVAALAVAVSYAGWAVSTDRYLGLDIGWHEGWIRQLAGGSLQPGGMYDNVPSAYPWMGNALGAVVMSVFGVGMTETLLVLEGVSLLALGLGMWVLSGELGFGAPARAWSAALALGGGGLGWLLSPGRHAIERVDASTIGIYHGDFLLAPAPTTALGNVPPALPRDIGWALLPLAVWLFLRAANTDSAWTAAAAGAAAALLVMTAPIAAICVGLGAVAVAAARRTPRLLGIWLVAAGLVTSVWTGPLAWHARELGGLARLSRIPPISPNLQQLAVAWGVMLPLAVAGLIRIRGRPKLADRRALVVLVVALVVPAVITALAPPIFSAEPAFDRPLRYLPSATIGLSLLGGLAAAWAVTAAGRYALVAAAGLCLAVFPTPILASMGAAHTAETGTEVLRCPRQLPAGVNDTVAVLSPSPRLTDLVSRGVFSLTGAHVVFTPDPRIRYRDVSGITLSESERRAVLRDIRAGGVPPTWVTLLAVDRRLRTPVPDGAVQCTFGPRFRFAVYPAR